MGFGQVELLEQGGVENQSILFNKRPQFVKFLIVYLEKYLWKPHTYLFNKSQRDGMKQYYVYICVIDIYVTITFV